MQTAGKVVGTSSTAIEAKRRQKLVATERQRLGEIVGHVADAGNMPNAKLALGLDGLVGEPDRHLVVAMDDGGGLRVPKVMEDLAFGDSKSWRKRTCRRTRPLGPRNR